MLHSIEYFIIGKRPFANVQLKEYGTLTDHLDKLCSYFGCRIEQLAEHIPDEKATTSPEQGN